jgi:hypothetical protein
MDGRRGERVGWTCGCLGSSLWMIPTSIILLWSGRIASGLCGLGFFALSVAACVYLAPWRHPRVRFWKLFLPVCVIMMLAAIFLLGVEGSPRDRRALGQLAPVLLFMMIPLTVVGRRRWDDGNPNVAFNPPAAGTPGKARHSIPADGN